MPRHQATPIRRGPGCLWARAGSRCDCCRIAKALIRSAAWLFRSKENHRVRNGRNTLIWPSLIPAFSDGVRTPGASPLRNSMPPSTSVS